jgi:hypothetical protein
MGNKELDLCMQMDHMFWMGDLNYRLDIEPAADPGLENMKPTIEDGSNRNLKQDKAEALSSAWEVRALNLQATFPREHPGNIQGTFRAH